MPEQMTEQHAGYKLKTVAASLNVHRATVWQWVKAGKLEAYQLNATANSTWRVPRSVVLAKYGTDVVEACDRIESTGGTGK